MLIGKTTPFKIPAKLFTLHGTVKGNSPFGARFLRMRSVSWIAPFGHETDMHPVDLIRDSSMTGYAEILTGEPDAKINLQGSSK